MCQQQTLAYQESGRDVFSLIRVETAASSRMFKPLWQHGRAICFADGWFKWKREEDKKQPYFIHRKDGQPILMAAIGSTPFERGDEAEGFLIVTAAADKGLVDIHDRRPLVLVPDAAREWMRQDVSVTKLNAALAAY